VTFSLDIWQGFNLRLCRSRSYADRSSRSQEETRALCNCWNGRPWRSKSQKQIVWKSGSSSDGFLADSYDWVIELFVFCEWHSYTASVYLLRWIQPDVILSMTKCTSADVPDLPSLLTPNSVTSDPFKSQPYLPGEIRCKASALNDFSAFTATKTFLVAKYYRDLWLWLNCQTSPIRYQISPNRSTPDLSCQVMGPRSGTIRLWKTYRSVQIWTIRYDTKCISHSKADG